jgi:hypothetical protein
MINIRIAMLGSTLLHTVHIRRLSLVIKITNDQSQLWKSPRLFDIQQFDEGLL